MTPPARHSRTAPAAIASAEEIRSRVREAVIAALDTKAENVRVRHLEPVTSFADYFVIASATNERQVQAIANSVEERLVAIGVRPLHVEGYSSAQWVLLDYGDFLVHSLLEERRDYYALERLWRDAPDVTPDFTAGIEPETRARAMTAEESESPGSAP
jgi:ribosome-associated protein